MKNRKLLVWILVLALMVSFAGCAQTADDPVADTGEETKETEQTREATAAPEEEEEPVTLTIFHSMQGVLPSEILDNPVMEKLQEETGVILDWSPYMGGDDPSEAISRLIASEDLPDIIIHTDPAINKSLMENGLIIELDSLVNDYGSDITENFSEALDFHKLMWSNDTGNLYFIPGNIENVPFWPMGYDLTFQIRWDLYKEMGSPSLESADDLFNYAVEANKLESESVDGKKTYAAGIPLADPGGWSYIDWDFAHYDGFMDSNSIIYYDTENDAVAPRLHDPNNSFWEGMEFYNKLYREGLLDPESATMKFQQCQDKGKALRYHIGMANWQIGWPNGEIFARGLEDTMGFVPILLDSKEDYTVYRFFFDVGNGALWSISKDCEYPEKAMELFNYTATFEGAELFYNGPEGVLWKTVDGIPTTIKFDPPKTIDELKEIGTPYVSPNFVINGIADNPDGYKVKYADNDPDRYKESMTQMELDFCEEFGLDYPTQIYDTRENHVASMALINSVRPDPTSEIAVLQTDIENVLDIEIVKVIYSETEEEFEANKAKLLEILTDMQIEKVYSWYEDNYEAAKQKIKELG